MTNDEAVSQSLLDGNFPTAEPKEVQFMEFPSRYSDGIIKDDKDFKGESVEIKNEISIHDTPLEELPMKLEEKKLRNSLSCEEEKKINYFSIKSEIDEVKNGKTICTFSPGDLALLKVEDAKPITSVISKIENDIKYENGIKTETCKKNIVDNREERTLKGKCYPFVKITRSPTIERFVLMEKLQKSQETLQVGEKNVKVKKHVPKGCYTCGECNFTFSYKPNLVAHVVSIHLKTKNHKCNLCDKSFSTTSNLIGHRKTHSSVRPLVCALCGRAFKTKNRLIRHSKIHFQEKCFKCKICAKQFFRKDTLTHHQVIHDDDALSYECNECGRVCRSKTTLIHHLRTHSGVRPHKCDICNRTFIQLSHFNHHRRSHIEVKRFTCSTCNKGFNESYSYNSHLLIHTGVKPYDCDLCGKSLRTRSHLQDHINAEHLELFKCHTCLRKYSTKGILKNHKCKGKLKVKD